MPSVYDPTVRPVSMSRPAMRLFAMCILMISDLDVGFTLFTFPAYFGQGSWYVPLILCIFGCVYAFGSWRAVENSRAQAALNMFEFINKKKMDSTGDTRWIRNYKKENRTGHSGITTFDSNDEVEYVLLLPFAHLQIEQQESFKNGIVLLKQWITEFTEARDSNKMEYQHSIPFYRLASFGWQGDLDPMDFAGILNANALYSFTVGTPQLFFSSWSIFTTEEGDNSILFISALIGFVSLVISLVNIRADFTKRLRQLICKEQLLADRKKEGPQRFAMWEKRIQEKLRGELEAVKQKHLELGTGEQPCLQNCLKLAATIEEYENKEKFVLQGLRAQFLTEQITDIFSEEHNRMPGGLANANTVNVSACTIFTWILSFFLLHANVGVHAYLMLHAFTQTNGETDSRMFYVGVVVFIVVGLLKFCISWHFASGAYASKPKLLTLSENLSVVLPLATSVAFMGKYGLDTAEYSSTLGMELAGTIVAISEVIVSTCLESANPRAIGALNSCCRKGRVDISTAADNPPCSEPGRP